MISHFWMKANTITTGTAAMMPPAARAPRSTLSALIRVFRPTGMVCFSWLLRNIRANRKWFQEWTKAKEPTAISPGRSSGRTTTRNARILPHPSTQAASSREYGTFLMKLLIRIIDNGSWKTVSAMMTLPSELIICSPAKISNSGTRSSAPGTNWEHSRASMKTRLTRKSNRASA